MSVAPEDSTGLHPALTGFVPVTTSRRFVARLLDGVMATTAVGVGFAAGSMESLAPMVLMVLAFAAAQLWAFLVRGARLGGLILGQQFVDVTTGQVSGGKTLLKYVLQSTIGALTLGIVEMVMSVATLQPPLNRNWFDRTTGLMLVDVKAGRRPVVDPAPIGGSAGSPPPPPIAAVEMPRIGAMPDQTSAGAAGHSSSEVPSWGAPSKPSVAPIRMVGVDDVNGGFIEATPFGRSPNRVAETLDEPSVERPLVVVREARPVVPDLPDATVLTPDANLAGIESLPGHGGGVSLWFDDGTRLDVGGTIVMGRNPQRPPGAVHAEARAIPDPSMSLSKSHAMIGPAPGGLWVTDLHSTNGVRVAPAPNRIAEPVTPGERVVVPVGGRLEFGSRSAVVMAR